MAAIRRAQAVWEGDLAHGKGQLRAHSSNAFSWLPVTWASRTEQGSGGKTSPEELLAAAHASCFSMALSAELARAGTPAQRLEVEAEVSFDKTDQGFRVVSSILEVRGDVPGVDAGRFEDVARSAKDNCPISQALKGNVRLDVRATLRPGAGASPQP